MKGLVSAEQLAIDLKRYSILFHTLSYTPYFSGAHKFAQKDSVQSINTPYLYIFFISRSYYNSNKI